MAKQMKQIPAQAFYTALPQLLSRVIHDDKDSEMIVRGILKRVLIKFPAQALWALGWLRLSRDPERRKAGDNIFEEAKQTLGENPNKIYQKLIVSSKTLIQYLHQLAKFQVTDPRTSMISVKAWKGEADLSDFVPPIQAALSISMSTGDSGRTRDVFPRQVPRMKAFAPKVSKYSFFALVNVLI